MATKATQTQQYAVVLFDLDGTLIESLGSFSYAAQKALQEFSINPPPRDTLTELIKKPFNIVIKAIRPDIDGDLASELVRAYVRIYNQEGYRLVKPNLKSTTVVRTLKESGRKVGIVTARTLLSDSLRPTLDYIGLSKYVDVLVTPLDVSKPKPEPDQHILALKRLNASPNEALSIGDSPEDVKAAKSAGITSVAYTGGFFPREALLLERPDFTINDLDKVLELVGLSRASTKQRL